MRLGPLRVLYVHHQSGVVVGGALRSLCRLLEEVDGRLFKPLVLSTGDPLDGLLPEGEWEAACLPIPPVRKGKFLHRLPFSLIAMIRLLREKRADIVHLNELEETPLFHAARKWIGGIPLVVHLRSLNPPERIRKYWLHRADRLICVSRAVMESAAQAGVPGERMSVVYDTIQPRWFGAVGEERVRRAREGWFPGGAFPILGTVGNISRMKGTDLLIRAAVSLSKDFPKAACLLVGADEHRMSETLAKEAAEGGLGNFVYAGPLADPQEAVSSMDIAVFPSREEGLSLAVMEAMAMGKPIVAARVGGIPELVEDGKTGLLVPPDDAESLLSAMLRLANRPEFRAELGRNARARAERLFFSPPFARQVGEIYLELAAGRTRRGTAAAGG